MHIDAIKPGVAVIIIDDQQRVLLQKRADVGLWCIPSGNVEPGETIAEAAIREIKEEMNLTISIIKLIGVYSDPDSQIFQYPNGKTIHFVTSCFLAQIVEGTFKMNDESLDIQFFPITALPQPLLKMHPQWLEDALSDKQEAFIR